MEHAFDLDRGDGCALQRAQKHAAERVAEGHSEAALQRLGDENRTAARIAGALLALQRVRLLQFLPVLRVDGHFSSLAWAGEVGSRPKNSNAPGSQPAATAALIRRGGASKDERRCAGSASRRGSR